MKPTKKKKPAGAVKVLDMVHKGLKPPRKMKGCGLKGSIDLLGLFLVLCFALLALKVCTFAWQKLAPKPLLIFNQGQLDA